MVKLLKEVDKDAFDISNWLKENINDRIRDYSTENLERQMAARRSNVAGISPVEHSLEKLKLHYEKVAGSSK